MRKRCIRRVYQLVNPITLAVQGAAITPQKALDMLRLRELSAIESFRAGSAEVSDWRTLADLVNLTETMATEGVGHDALPTCHAAQAALERAHDRREATGHFGIDGPGLQALRELYEWHDAQRSAIARSRYEQLIALTVARMRTAMSQVRQSGVRVLS
jgi:hypothetical protein